MITASVKPPADLSELLPPALAAALDRLDVHSRKVLLGKLQGERRSKRRGRSVEFDDYREYAAGDDLRHVDWNVFARMDRFFVKVFQEEEDLSVEIALDVSASMRAGSPSKAMFAARLAMALGYIGLVKNNRVSMSVFGGRGPKALVQLAPSRGRRNIQRIGAFLLEHAFGAAAAADSSAGPTSGTGPPARQAFTSAMTTLAQSGRGRGVVFVLTDLLVPPRGGYEAGLGALGAATASGSLDATVLQVLSPGEIDPALEREGDDQDQTLVGDLRLTDVETGKAAEVTLTSDLLAVYKKRATKYIEQCAAFCRSRGLGHVLTPSNTDLATLIVQTLRQRGVVR